MGWKTAKPLLVKAGRQWYSAAAAAKAAPAAAPPEGLQVSKVPSGAVVATLEDDSPLSRIAVFVKAGPRYNTSPGISQVFRLYASAGLSTNHSTGFVQQRVLSSVGSKYYACFDRETAMYAIIGTRNHIGENLGILSDITSNTSYVDHEMAHHGAGEYPDPIAFMDTNPMLRAAEDKAVMSPSCAVVDLATEAAYRAHPLANSTLVLFDHRSEAITAACLNAYAQATHGSSGVTVVGAGVSHEVLVAAASTLGVTGGSVATSTKAVYLGGDLRQDTDADIAHVAVLGQGVELGSADAPALAVAAQVLGGGPGTRNGGNASSMIAKALKETTGMSFHGVSVNYSDTGLFGFYLGAPAAQAPAAVRAVVAAVKKFTASDADLAGAKARAKAALLPDHDATGFSEVMNIGRHLLHTGHYDAAAAAIDAVSAADVTKVVKKAFSGKLTVAAIGGVNDVPYSDAL